MLKNLHLVFIIWSKLPNHSFTNFKHWAWGNKKQEEAHLFNEVPDLRCHAAGEGEGRCEGRFLQPGRLTVLCAPLQETTNSQSVIINQRENQEGMAKTEEAAKNYIRKLKRWKKKYGGEPVRVNLRICSCDKWLQTWSRILLYSSVQCNGLNNLHSHIKGLLPTRIINLHHFLELVILSSDPAEDFSI